MPKTIIIVSSIVFISYRISRAHKSQRLPTMTNEIKVVIYGVGSIGELITKTILKKKGLKIAGAIDIAKDKAGNDLGDLIGLEKRLGLLVSDNPDSVFGKIDADVALVSTTSYISGVYPQLIKCIKSGMNVISTCEELVYSWRKEPKLSSEIDGLAKRYGVTVLGTGINPGFLMDTLVLTLTAVCQEIKQIKVSRVMNAGSRRLSFQKKIGVGLTVQEFGRKIEKKTITGHVGLEQSIAMIADSLGWELDEMKVDQVKPIIAKEPTGSKYFKVKPGEVTGLRQVARGILEDREVIVLDFLAHIGGEREYDSINIKGIPNIQEKISPCVHGDLGTVAIVLNCIPKVINAPPGLLTMRNLPPPSAIVDDARVLLNT